MNKKIVLFVCKHNMFRSKIAEAFFNKFNTNKNYSCLSAGLIPGNYPLDKLQIEIAKEFGIKLAGKPKPITTDLLRKINTMVIVADNVASDIFNNNKYGRKEIEWKIEDDNHGNIEEIRMIITKIKDRVVKFIRGLK